MCGKQFRSNTLKHHIDSVHKPQKDMKCPECKKVCKGEKALKNHQKVHLGLVYKCNICNEQFTFNASLKSHIRARHMEEKFPCQICKYNASRKDILEFHIASKHVQDKKYNCKLCDFQSKDRRIVYLHKEKELTI